MDLVNQDLEVREELKQAFSQVQRYLIAEPSGKEEDLSCDNIVKIDVPQEDEKKWPIGFCAQTVIFFRRNWVLTSKSQFSTHNCAQATCLSS